MSDEKHLGMLPLATTTAALDVVRMALTDPAVTPEKAREAFALFKDMEHWQAEKDFVAAFGRLRFPPIKKTKAGGKSKYAPYEDIQEVIEPILEREGFTFLCGSGPPDDKGHVPVIGTLSHIAGHSIERCLYLPSEKSTPAMNNTQAMGSAISYGQRYLAKMMLNLRFVDEDDDGRGLSLVTQPERDAIEDMLHEIGEDFRPQFLKACGVKAVSDIQRGAFTAAMSLLKIARKDRTRL